MTEIVYKHGEDGSFTAGDKTTGFTAYAYPSSYYAGVATRKPQQVAEEMLGHEEGYMRVVPSVQEYDQHNWERLNS